MQVCTHAHTHTHTHSSQLKYLTNKLEGVESLLAAVGFKQMGLESSFKCCFAYRHEGRDGVSGTWPIKQYGLWALKKKFLNVWGWVGQWRVGISPSRFRNMFWGDVELHSALNEEHETDWRVGGII